MADFKFNPFGTKAIIVKFNCDQCSSQVESEEISIPLPNFSADNARDSQINVEELAVCMNCNKNFNIDIFVTIADGGGNIDNIPDNYDIDIVSIPEQ